MKKILFGSAAAICTVVGFSSFKAKQKSGTLYYFQANSGVNITPGNEVLADDVSWYATTNVTPSSPCDNVASKICVISVTVGKVTSTDRTHLSGPVSSSERATVYERSTQN